MTQANRLRSYGVIISLILIADQLTKLWVQQLGQQGRLPIRVWPVFDLVLAWNRGISFSLLNQFGQVGRYALSGLALGVVGFLSYWLWQARCTWRTTGLCLIIGGALGNVIDRLRLGAVVDFLHFHVDSFSWPAFNVADTAITIGVGLVLVCHWIHKGENHA